MSDASSNLSQKEGSFISGLTFHHGEHLLGAIAAVFIGFLFIGLAIYGHTISPLPAIAFTFTLAAFIAYGMPATAVVIVFVGAIFQNLFVSLVSPDLSGSSDFNIVRGYSFISIAAIWSVSFAYYVFFLRGQSKTLDLFLNVTTILLAVLAFYFALGFIKNPIGSIIYLRNIATGIFLFQLCVIVFSQYDIRISYVFNILIALLIIIGYIELFYRQEWVDWINGQDYFNLSYDQKAQSGWDKDARERGIVVKSFLDALSVDFLNTPLLSDLKIKIVRLLGPNQHAISYGYLMAFFAIYSFFTGAFLTALLILPLIFFANVKGALILIFLVGCAWFAAKLFGMRFGFYSLTAVLIFYFFAGIIIGLDIGDYHVLGFMGGVHNFIENPFGRGIGTGGNLSTNFSGLNWEDYQAAGRTPFAVESSVGVLMFQIGVATFFYLYVGFWIAWKTLKIAAKTQNSLHLAAGFALMVILVNGVFQEEAIFSPYGFGFLMALNGIIQGASIRTGLSR